MEQFVVSARKYRPATFASVVGQKHITSTLKNAIERNQLAHAYLFCGPRGVGKTTCARIFAKAINCLNPVGAEACNECESCRSFNEGRSMTIHELDAASNNSVEDIRNLIEQVRIIPQVGRYSVFIIDEVHMLSQAAFNAFLKTLEEPPQHAIFILATTEKHKIIPTILSRCQIYDFNRIRVEDAVEYLRYIAQNEGVTADDESLNLIAQKADGGMRDALSMFDKAVSFCGANLEYKTVAQTLNVLDYDTYFRFTDLLLQGDYVNALLDFDKVLMQGFGGQVFMNGLNQHLRDLLVAKGPAVNLIEFTGTLLERYREQATRTEVPFLFGAISLLSEADGKMRTTSNQRLLVELTLMKIAALAQKKNSDLTLEADEFYPLPDLGAMQSVVNQPSTTIVAQAPVPTPSVQAQVVQSPSAQPQEPIAQPQVQSVQPQGVQPMPQLGSLEQMSAPTEQTERGKRISLTKAMQMGSLTQMMQSVRESEGVEEEQAIAGGSDVESRLNDNREAFVAEITRRHPRLIPAFEKVRIEGNKVVVEVPTRVLNEDLNSCRSEIQEIIAECAELDGVPLLEIVVNETEIKLRPVKIEDRLAHIASCSPLFEKLVATMKLNIE
ncbi:MAG: DNA polymerase III subunit gamma/tau [Alistipes sp.]|nr:DNA polymerase III subunit gamma/tau [Alistipes sp.]